MDFLRKVRLKHAGFVIGATLLFLGWILRFAAAFIMPEFAGPSACNALDRAGYYLSGSSVVFLFGGIAFWAFVSAREEKEEPQEPLAEDQVRERRKSELEDMAGTIKNSIPFTAIYGLFSIFLVLGSSSRIAHSDQGSGWMDLGLIAGLFLSQHYIRKSIRQFKWLSWYKRTGGKENRVIEEYTIGTTSDSAIALRIFDNGTAYALFDNFPLDGEEANRFVEEFSRHIGAKVMRDDRELFILMSNREDVMGKAAAFLQCKSAEWEKMSED